jgi:hypothetical protein
MMEPGPTLKNGREGESLDMGICSFCKAARLMRLRVVPPSIRTWYSLMLAMIGETTSRSYPAPNMFLGQSEALNMIDICIHLWWGHCSRRRYSGYHRPAQHLNDTPRRDVPGHAVDDVELLLALIVIGL